MADLNPAAHTTPTTPIAPKPPSSPPLRPTITPPQSLSQSPPPAAPLSGLQVKSTDMSKLSPSPTQGSNSPTPSNTSMPIKSSIRTMEEDLVKTKTSPPPSIPPSIPLKPSSTPSPPVPIKPPAQSIKVPAVNIPPTNSGGSKKWLVLLLFILILGGLGLWYFVFRDEKEVVIPDVVETATFTPFPVATETPAPVPQSLEEIFRPGERITCSSTIAKTAQTELDASINQQRLSVGEIKVLNVSDVSGNQKNLAQFVTDQKLSFPNNVMAGLDPTQFYFTLYGKPDGSLGRGFVVKIQDKAKLSLAMQQWEPNMTKNLAELFQINLTKASSTTFTISNYKNIPVHYKNFPDAFSTVDYGYILFENGDDYLVLTNTRDHFFAFIDKLQGTTLGK